MSEQDIAGIVLASLVQSAAGDEWDGQAALPLPRGDVSVMIRTADGDVTETQRAALRCALSLTPEGVRQLEETVYADHQMMDEAADGIPPIAAPDAVWEHTDPYRLAIPAHEGLQHRYFTIEFEVDWEVEHGAEVLFRDGLPVELDIIGSTGTPESYDS